MAGNWYIEGCRKDEDGEAPCISSAGLALLRQQTPHQ